jgi:hypothetical protein
MSAIELRTLVAAQIAAAMMANLPTNPPEPRIREMAEAAVRVAKAIEEAVATSLTR